MENQEIMETAVEAEMVEDFDEGVIEERDYSGLIVLGSFGLGMATDRIVSKVAPKVRGKFDELREFIKSKKASKKEEEPEDETELVRDEEDVPEVKVETGKKNKK